MCMRLFDIDQVIFFVLLSVNSSKVAERGRKRRKNIDV